MTNYLPPSIAKYHNVETIDPSTFSNYNDYHVRNTHLDWNVSFDKEIIFGSVSYYLTLKDSVTTATSSSSPNVVHLDTSYLDISKITVGLVQEGSTVYTVSKDNWYLKERMGDLGSELVIEDVNSVVSSGKEFKLTIEYSTTDKCTALQWLNGEQSGDTPYVFAQLEPIHARALMPSFDTPGLKSKYTAVINSPQPVCFSGLPRKVDSDVCEFFVTSTATDNNRKDVYEFVQDWPIPTYLLVIASGNIHSGKIGPRSTVYAQPHFLQNSINQFTPDMENMIKASEEILYAYPSEDYSISIMPSSYPFGGCECMNCTILSPSILNKKFADVNDSTDGVKTTEFNSTVAHELMHTFSGNLVTNSTWEHMWLNEGTCVLLERKVLAKVFNDPKIRGFESLNGWNDLQNSIDNMDNAERFSCLVHDYSDKINPDLGFSTVFYEKGAALHYTIESLVGGEEHYDKFLKHYFQKFSFQSINTWQFLDCLYEFFFHYDKAKYDVLYSEMDWDLWLFTPGMPPKPDFDSTLCDKVYKLTEKWVDATRSESESELAQFSEKDLDDFSVGQVILLLDALTNDKELGIKNWYEFPHVANKFLTLYGAKFQELKGYAETDFRLFKFKIHARVTESYTELSAWLGTIGRMKFVRPSYVLLKSVNKELAIETFKKFEHTYHPICHSMVKQDLGLK